MQSLVRATMFNAVIFLAGSSLVACSGSVSSSGGSDDADGNGGGAGGSDIPPPDPNFKPMGDPDVNKLLAPEFIFRPEYGSGVATDGAVKLTSHEVASRLSYLLWDTMPDADPFAAADAKKLDTADGIETQLRRMMNDSRAREAVQRFSSQWLGLSKFDAPWAFRSIRLASPARPQAPWASHRS